MPCLLNEAVAAIRYTLGKSDWDPWRPWSSYRIKRAGEAVRLRHDLIKCVFDENLTVPFKGLLAELALWF